MKWLIKLKKKYKNLLVLNNYPKFIKTIFYEYFCTVIAISQL